MKTFIHISAFLVALAPGQAFALGIWAGDNPANANYLGRPTETEAPATNAPVVVPQGTASGAPSTTVVLPSVLPSFKPGAPVPSQTTAAPAAGPAAPHPSAQGGGVMTWSIINKYNVPLSIAYLNNADSPSAIGSPKAAPLPTGASTAVAFPVGWAGRVIVGKSIDAGAGNSLIEGSTTGPYDLDVSFVDGFSVPVSCSSPGQVVSGCNIDLWAGATKCPGTVLGDNAICTNPMNTPVGNGPADTWFLPCQGAAYTFPNDNIANWNQGSKEALTVTCCIGTAAQGCPAPARQGKCKNVPTKRSLPKDSDEISGGEMANVTQGDKGKDDGPGIDGDVKESRTHKRAHLARHKHGF